MSTPSDAGTGGDEVPTCYRHPGRETYVSCVRCGRHACPDCMRSASVGQQCVDCVGEGARSTRQARTTFGGLPVAGAVVTWTLVAINVAVFLVTWVRPGIVTDLEMLGYAPYTAGGPLHGVAAGEWYRLITSAFLAPATGLNGLGFLDILFNMWALVFVGPALEGSARPGPLPRRVPAQRHRRRGDVLLPRAARTIRRRAPPAPSSGCSERGSWCPGGCTSTPAGSSC